MPPQSSADKPMILHDVWRFALMQAFLQPFRPQEIFNAPLVCLPFRPQASRAGCNPIRRNKPCSAVAPSIETGLSRRHCAFGE
jgi:hypothetical protein